MSLAADEIFTNSGRARREKTTEKPKQNARAEGKTNKNTKLRETYEKEKTHTSTRM
jgi:hypothetical protein